MRYNGFVCRLRQPHRLTAGVLLEPLGCSVHFWVADDALGREDGQGEAWRDLVAPGPVCTPEGEGLFRPSVPAPW